jgi:predicted dehydrogenase
LTVKDLVQREVLGDIFHVEMFRGGYNPPKGWWRDNKDISGGAFYDWGAHYIDYLLGLIPVKVQSVRGFTQNRLWHQMTNEDQVDSIIQFENGAVAHIQLSSIAFAGKPHFRILGTKGAIVVSNMSKGNLSLYTERDGAAAETIVPYLHDIKDSYYDNIADHLYNSAELLVKPEQARRIIAIIETTEKSALAGTELNLPYENE